MDLFRRFFGQNRQYQQVNRPNQQMNHQNPFDHYYDRNNYHDDEGEYTPVNNQEQHTQHYHQSNNHNEPLHQHEQGRGGGRGRGRGNQGGRGRGRVIPMHQFRNLPIQVFEPSRKEVVARENFKMVNDHPEQFNAKKPESYKVKDLIQFPIPKGEKMAEINPMKGTVGEAIDHYRKKGFAKIVVKSFANSHTVGGGYWGGCMAQEEEVMRTIPDLYTSLTMDAEKHGEHYSYRDDDFNWHETIKFSKDLTLCRLDKVQSNGDFTLLDPKDRFKISVITAAAPNLGSDQKLLNAYVYKNKAMMEVISKILQACFVAPLVNDQEEMIKEKSVLIFGAFGCGVFSPCDNAQKCVGAWYAAQIAHQYKKILEANPNIRTVYDEICFAIPAGHNYDMFRLVLSGEDENTQ
jgi:uncharacterized protein (TIGR02452 family)